MVPSISSHSSSGSPLMALESASNKPAVAHRRNRRNGLFQLPKAGGKSRRGAPVRTPPENGFQKQTMMLCRGPRVAGLSQRPQQSAAFARPQAGQRPTLPAGGRCCDLASYGKLCVLAISALGFGVTMRPTRVERCPLRLLCGGLSQQMRRKPLPYLIRHHKATFVHPNLHFRNLTQKSDPMGILIVQRP